MEGDDVFLEDITLTIPIEDGTTTSVPAGNMHFEDVTLADDGDISVAFARMDGFLFDADSVQVAIGAAEIVNLYIPADKYSGETLPFVQYDALSGQSSTIVANGAEIASIGSFTATMDQSALPLFTSETSLTNIQITPPDPLPPEAAEVLQALELQSIKMDARANLVWNTETGDLSIQDYDIFLENAGSLGLELTIGGYTMDTATAYTKTIEDMSAAGKMSEAEQLQVFMTLLQGLSLSGAEISFTDSGLTKRALDYAGKKQGSDGDQLASMLPFLIGMGLNSLELPEALTTQITGSLTSYFANPGNITVTAAPDSAIPFMELFNVGTATPTNLPVLLNLSVSANH